MFLPAAALAGCCSTFSRSFWRVLGIVRSIKPTDPDEGDARGGFLLLTGNETGSVVIQRNEKVLPRVLTALGFVFFSVRALGVENSRYTQQASSSLLL